MPGRNELTGKSHSKGELSEIILTFNNFAFTVLVLWGIFDKFVGSTPILYPTYYCTVFVGCDVTGNRCRASCYW